MADFFTSDRGGGGYLDLSFKCSQIAVSVAIGSAAIQDPQAVCRSGDASAGALDFIIADDFSSTMQWGIVPGTTGNCAFTLGIGQEKTSGMFVDRYEEYHTHRRIDLRKIRYLGFQKQFALEMKGTQIRVDSVSITDADGKPCATLNPSNPELTDSSTGGPV